MKRVSYIRHEKLHNVMGRISYISSEAKQEHLYATYETQPREYWRELAKENRDDFFRSGTDGTCIEAREFIIALPEVYYKEEVDPNELLRYFAEEFKKEYGAECVAALHHNHDMTNYHIHLIYSERDKLDEPVKKIASRNMFFDPDGRHLRTKRKLRSTENLCRATRWCQRVKYMSSIFSTRRNQSSSRKTSQSRRKHSLLTRSISR